MRTFYVVLKVSMLSLNVGLIGWVIYVLKDILLYGHHTAQEPNTSLLVGEIVVCSVGVLAAVTVLVIEIRRAIKK